MSRAEIIELILALGIFLVLIGIGVWTVNMLYTLSMVVHTILG